MSDLFEKFVRRGMAAQEAVDAELYSSPGWIGKGQGSLAGFDLVKGQRIRLNDRARTWTYDLIFNIEEWRPFGVICSTIDGPRGVHRLEDGRAMYLATWDQISGIV